MNEYETYNNALKTDMPTFMRLAAQFINPLFHSFYYMQYVQTYTFMRLVTDLRRNYPDLTSST